MATAPDRNAVIGYLGPDHSYTDAEIDAQLASETLAQASVCRIPTGTDPYPADLATALCRRAVRALNMQYKPLGYDPGVDGGLSYISANDSEIKRLEAPYRKRATPR